MTPALGYVGFCCGLGRAPLSNLRGLVALGASTEVWSAWDGPKTELRYFQNSFFICFCAHLFWVVVFHSFGNHFLSLVREDPAYRFLLGPFLNTHLSIVTSRASQELPWHLQNWPVLCRLYHACQVSLPFLA